MLSQERFRAIKFFVNRVLTQFCVLPCLLVPGCKWHAGNKPVIEFTRVPPAGEGGPDKLDAIEGKVKGALPGQHIVLYAKAGSIWWIQPLAIHPLTAIESDSTWKNSTHLGTEYAAILVDPGYDPALTVKALPSLGHGVLAVALATVGVAPPINNQTLKFSGYEWSIRHITSDRNGSISYYDPANAWTDSAGHLHLRITREKVGLDDIVSAFVLWIAPVAHFDIHLTMMLGGKLVIRKHNQRCCRLQA